MAPLDNFSGNVLAVVRAQMTDTTTNALAAAVVEHVSRPRLYRIMAGEVPMTVLELGAICNALGVLASDVVRAAEGKPRSQRDILRKR